MQSAEIVEAQRREQSFVTQSMAWDQLIRTIDYTH